MINVNNNSSIKYIMPLSNSQDKDANTVVEDDQQINLDKIAAEIKSIMQTLSGYDAGNGVISNLQAELSKLAEALDKGNESQDLSDITESVDFIQDMLTKIVETVDVAKENVNSLALEAADDSESHKELMGLLGELGILSDDMKQALTYETVEEQSTALDANASSLQVLTASLGGTMLASTSTSNIAPDISSHSVFSKYSQLQQFGGWRLSVALTTLVCDWYQLAALQAQVSANKLSYAQEVYNMTKALSYMLTSMSSDVSQINSATSSSDKSMSDVTQSQARNIKLFLQGIIDNGKWINPAVSITNVPSYWKNDVYSPQITADSPENYKWLSALIDAGVLEMYSEESSIWIGDINNAEIHNKDDNWYKDYVGEKNSDGRHTVEYKCSNDNWKGTTVTQIRLKAGPNYNSFLNGNMTDAAMFNLTQQTAIMASVYSTGLADGSSTISFNNNDFAYKTSSDATELTHVDLRSFAQVVIDHTTNDDVLFWGGVWSTKYGDGDFLQYIANDFASEEDAKANFSPIYQPSTDSDNGLNFFNLKDDKRGYDYSDGPVKQYKTSGPTVGAPTATTDSDLEGTTETVASDGTITYTKTTSTTNSDGTVTYTYYSIDSTKSKTTKTETTFATLSSSTYIVDGTTFEKYPNLLAKMKEVFYNGKPYNPKQYAINAVAAKEVFGELVYQLENVLGKDNSGLTATDGSKLLSTTANSSWLSTLTSSVDNTAKSVYSEVTQDMSTIQNQISSMTTYSDFFSSILAKLTN